MGAKTILVTSGKGGVGKTTVAVELGSSLESQGKRVHIIDLDPQMGVANRLEGIEASFTHITSDELDKDHRAITEDKIQNIIDENDIVIFDSGPNRNEKEILSSYVREWIDRSDLVLVPFKCAKMAIQASLVDVKGFSAAGKASKVLFVPVMMKNTKVEKQWLSQFKTIVCGLGFSITEPLKDLVLWAEAESFNERSALEYARENYKDQVPHIEAVLSEVEGRLN